MQTEAILSKMLLAHQSPVQAYAEAGTHLWHLNAQIGKQMTLVSSGLWTCKACRETFTTLFRMGCCKRCFFESPVAGEAILRPELSTAHLGQADRDLAYESQYQLQPHVVYLADTGSIKVGVTRKEQRYTRWMDQGASRARIIAITANRYEAGAIEVALKERFTDKTSWRQMLGGIQSPLNLELEAMEARVFFPDSLVNYFKPDGEEIAINYPAEAIHKCTALRLSNNQQIEGVLRGIRGQYLVLSGNRVFNVRGHEGAHVYWGFTNL